MEDTATKMVDKEQIKKIHALKNALKMPDDYYRKLIFINYYPAASSKDLTFEDARSFISQLEKKAVEKGVWKKHEGKQAFERLGHRNGMASPAQLRMIDAIWKEVSRFDDDKKKHTGLRTFLLSRFKVSDLRFLDRRAAGKVISALKGMQQRKSAQPNMGLFEAVPSEKR